MRKPLALRRSRMPPILAKISYFPAQKSVFQRATNGGSQREARPGGRRAGCVVLAELGGLPELEASQNRIALRSGCSFAGNDGIFVTILPARSAASGSGIVSVAPLGVRRFRQGAAEVDEVVGDDAEPDPALHTIITFVSAAGEAVPALDDADAPRNRFAISGRCGTSASSAHVCAPRSCSID